MLLLLFHDDGDHADDPNLTTTDPDEDPETDTPGDSGSISYGIGFVLVVILIFFTISGKLRTWFMR